MLTYTQAKEAIKASDKETVRKVLEDFDEDILLSAIACDVQLEDIAEAYQGKYSSDEEFTRELLEECGDMPKDLPFYIHIDWEATARDIMMDYSEDNGYYFRRI